MPDTIGHTEDAGIVEVMDGSEDVSQAQFEGFVSPTEPEPAVSDSSTGALTQFDGFEEPAPDSPEGVSAFFDSLPEMSEDTESPAGGAKYLRPSTFVDKSGTTGDEESLAGAALRKTGNILLDTIMNLNRPLAAVTEGIKELPFVNTDEGDLLGAMYKGFKENRHDGVQEMLDDAYRRDYPVGTFVLGVGGSVILDPLTYTPARVLSVPIKIVGALAKGGFQLLNRNQVITRLADDLGVLRWLNVYHGDSKKAKLIADKFRDLRNGAEHRIIEDAKKFESELIEVSADMGIPVSELKANITDAIERRAIAKDAVKGKLSPKAAEISAKIVIRNKERLEIEKELGMSIDDIGKGYMAHIKVGSTETKAAETVQTAAEVRDFLAKQPSRTHVSQKLRKLEGTIKQLNEGNTKIFYDDPMIIDSIREFRHVMATGGQKYLDDVTTLGIASKNAPDNFQAVPGIKGIKFAPGVAKTIQFQFETLSSPARMHTFIKLFDGGQKWWKMWSLGARPAYHARNFTGNIWNAYAGGLSNPQRFADAADIQMAMRDGSASASDKLINGRTTKEIFNSMLDRGVLGRGEYHADIEQAIIKSLPGGKNVEGVGANVWKYTASTDNPVLQAGFKFGGYIENNARIALYLDRIKKGDNFDDAASHVKKYLFDYRDLSHVEQTYLKRAIPFYTWTRKNIPLQLEVLLRNPDKVQKINIIKNNIENGVEIPDENYVRDYVKQAGPVYLGNVKESDVAIVWTLMNYLPFMDLGRVLAPGELLSMVSPLMKAPFEYLANYDVFRDKQIEETKGQTAQFIGIDMPVHLAHLLKNLIMINELDRANPGNIFGKATLDEDTGVTERTRSFYQEESIDWTVPGVGLRRGGLGWDDRQALKVGAMKFAVGGKREKQTDLEGGARLVQYLIGMRTIEVDPGLGEIERHLKLRRDLRQLDRIINRAYFMDQNDMAERAVDVIQAVNEMFDIKEAASLKRKAALEREAN